MKKKIYTLNNDKAFRHYKITGDPNNMLNVVDGKKGSSPCFVFTFNEPITARYFMYNEGRVDLLDVNGDVLKPNHLTMTMESTRGNGKRKVLSEVPASEPRFTPGHTDDILHSGIYDFIFAIDTNTRELNGKTFSATSVVHLKSTGPKTYGFAETLGILFNPVGNVSPELVGWLLFLIELNRRGRHFEGATICLVTDYNRRMLSDYNLHKKEIFPGIFLPEGITLAYGSADRADGAAARAVRMADSVAGDYFLLDHAVNDLERCPLHEIEYVERGLYIQGNAPDNSTGWVIFTGNDRIGLHY